MNKASILATFNNLVGAQTRGSTKNQNPANGNTRQAEENPTALIEEWADHTTCRKSFIPFLDQRIAEAEHKRNDNLANHPLMTYWQGVVNETKEMRGLFAKWSSQNHEGEM